MLKKSKYTQLELLKEKARRVAVDDFWVFCMLMNKELYSQRKEPLQKIAKCLQRAYYSENGYKIAISTPPRTAKSTLINYFIAWCIGKDLNRSIIRATYGQELSFELSQTVRILLQEDEYLKIFKHMQDVEIVENSKRKLRFKEGKRASLFESSVNGTATGFGGEIIIADDLYKDHVQAMSKKINDTTINWYQSALKSRHDGLRRVEIIIGTRWRVGELVDILESQNYFDEVIKIRALDENDKSFNELIHPTNELLALRKSYNKMIFNSMYQQEPIDVLNGLFKIDDFDKVNDVAPGFRVALIDSKTTGKDNFVVVFAGITQTETVIEDFINTTETLTDDLETRIVDALDHYSVDWVFIESNKDYSFYRNIKNRYVYGKVIPFHTSLNKEMKILTYSRFVKRFKLIDTNDREYNRSIAELISYDLEGKNENDGVVDAMTMLAMKLFENQHKLPLGREQWK